MKCFALVFNINVRELFPKSILPYLLAAEKKKSNSLMAICIDKNNKLLK